MKVRKRLKLRPYQWSDDRSAAAAEAARGYRNIYPNRCIPQAEQYRGNFFQALNFGNVNFDDTLSIT
jgi:hypothetical protein